MHDQSCQVPSAVGQIAKSTGCCPGFVSGPRSGSPARVQKAPSIAGARLAAPPPPEPVAVPPLAPELAAAEEDEVAPAFPAGDPPQPAATRLPSRQAKIRALMEPPGRRKGRPPGG